MINCGRCGIETQRETVQGKNTVNCKACRGVHNIKNKRILKCEKMPEQGFYKQEKINFINNEPEDEQDEPEDKPEDLTDDLEDEPDKPEQDKQEQNKQEQNEQDILKINLPYHKHV